MKQDKIIYPTKEEWLKGKGARYKEGSEIVLQSGRKYVVQKDGSYKRAN